MNSQVNSTDQQLGTKSSELLDRLASQVDQQLVLELGGEFLEGSGFEHETPETGFERQGVQ